MVMVIVIPGSTSNASNCTPPRENTLTTHHCLAGRFVFRQECNTVVVSDGQLLGAGAGGAIGSYAFTELIKLPKEITSTMHVLFITPVTILLLFYVLSCF